MSHYNPCSKCGRLKLRQSSQCNDCRYRPFADVPGRFWAKVDKSGGPDACWPWAGHRSPQGYGKAPLPRAATAIYGARAMQAHRLAYVLASGPIPAGLLVLHSCDNPPCCNPAHLRVGTYKDNLRDMYERGRAVNRAPYGEAHPASKLTAAAVAEMRSRRGAGETLTTLAAAYGVSTSTVWRIGHRTSWRTVA